MTTPAAPRDPRPLTARGPSGPFSYTDEGSGPTLVAIHGLPGSVRDYRWLAAALPETVRFVRLDLPGFGGTPLSTQPGPTIDSRGAFVAEALAGLKIDRCVLIGHSMGGAVALSAAVQAPERVTALALLSSIGLRPHALIRRFIGRQALASAVDLPLVSGPTLLLLKAAFRVAGFSAQTTLAEVAHTTRCVAAVDFEAQRRNTARLSLPTLAAWADDDVFIEPRIFEEHAAALPPGPRLHWQTGGHNLQKSQAVELAAALTALVNG